MSLSNQTFEFSLNRAFDILRNGATLGLLFDIPLLSLVPSMGWSEGNRRFHTVFLDFIHASSNFSFLRNILMRFASSKYISMKKILIFIILFSTLVSCVETHYSNSFESNNDIPSNKGIYYWKTIFKLNDYELDFLKRHEIIRIYVKMFDVALQNNSPDDTLSVIPIATTRFKSHIPEGIEIVPTVYITYEALSHLKGKDREYIESYVQRILTRIDAMISYNEIQEVREVQFDCDWTSNTSYAYHCICDYAKRNLNKSGRKFSITLRLHQMDLEKYRFPSADRGVLMLYNTGSFKNPNSTNSILNYNDAQPYIRRHEVPFPVDYAYPTYSWSLLFRNNDFKCIVKDIDLNEQSLLQKTDYNRYIVQKDTLIGKLQLRKGDMIRHETSEYKEIELVKSDLTRRHDMKNSRQIIYHLDSTNLSNFSDHEIKYMLLAY